MIARRFKAKDYFCMACKQWFHVSAGDMQDKARGEDPTGAPVEACANCENELCEACGVDHVC